MLFRTMGLYWKRSDVFWGKPKNKGALFGVAKKARRRGSVDFWDQVGVYVLYSNFQLIYVGQTGTGTQRLGSRLRQHTTDDLAGRWDTFSWFGMLWVKVDGTLSSPATFRNPQANYILDLVEGVLIAAAEPPLNRQGGRFGQKVERYLQQRDDRFDTRDDIDEL